MKFKAAISTIAFILFLQSTLMAETNEINYGIGTDISAYFMNGYSLRASVVFDHLEIDMGIGRNDTPTWILTEGIESAVVEHTDLTIKYNLGKNVTNMFLGLICLYAYSDVDYSSTDDQVEFWNTALLASVGYNMQISNHFRLIPSLGAGYIFAGDKEKTIDGLTYSMENYIVGGAIELFYYF